MWDQQKRLLLALLAFCTFNASAAVLYVDVNATNPVPPYTNWASAAQEIQSAVDLAVAGDTVLVSNGVYDAGGRLVTSTSNRAAVTKALTLRSVNGPSVTTIVGHRPIVPGNPGPPVRCVYLTNGAVLTGFTLTNGSTSAESGGGVCCGGSSAVVSNCVLIGNSAFWGGGACSGTLVNCLLTSNWAQFGGGAYWATLSNCRIAGNSAAYSGGGAIVGSLSNCVLTGNLAGSCGGGASSAAMGGYCTLNNCTVTGNWAAIAGGGVFDCTVNNSIVYYNTAPGTESGSGTFNYSCTTPLPSAGVGSFTNAPLFANAAGGDVHLLSNSPCINAGNNAYAPEGPDLDGNPRFAGGTVDLGAYEFQAPSSTLSYAWLQQYGLPTDGSVDCADPDHDGLNNWQEWRAGTDPTNSASLLTILAAVFTNNPARVTVSWQSVSNRTYFLQRGTNLLLQAPFESIQSNIVGGAGTTSFTDTNAANGRSYFYRVGVQ